MKQPLTDSKMRIVQTFVPVFFHEAILVTVATVIVTKTLCMESVVILQKIR